MTTTATEYLPAEADAPPPVNSGPVCVSMVPDATSTATRDADALKIVEQIRAGKWRGPIEKIRKLYAEVLAKTGDTKAAKLAIDGEKKKRPGILWSGRFKNRKKPTAEKLVAHSGYLCADLDDLGDRLPEVRGKLKTSPHLVADFLSPSGVGLKALFRVPADAERHGDSFRAVEAHVRALTGVQIDTACRDVGRLCYVSFDPEAVLNPNAIELPVIETKGPAPAAARNGEAVNLSERRQIAEDILGPVRWSSDTEGFCQCPGAHLHSTTNGDRDFKVMVNGAPTGPCLHQHCRGIVEGINHELRSRIGKAEAAASRALTVTASPGNADTETELQFAKRLQAALPPVKTIGRTWHLYRDGAWKPQNPDALKPQALAILPSRSARSGAPAPCWITSRQRGRPIPTRSEGSTASTPMARFC